MISIYQNEAKKKVSDFQKHTKAMAQIGLSFKEDCDMRLVGWKVMGYKETNSTINKDR